MIRMTSDDVESYNDRKKREERGGRMELEERGEKRSAEARRRDERGEEKKRERRADGGERRPACACRRCSVAWYSGVYPSSPASTKGLKCGGGAAPGA